MQDEGLVSVTKMDPSTLEQEEVTLVDVWKFDFVHYDDATNLEDCANPSMTEMLSV